MTALDYILNGLEAELALERELGVRFIECDRTVLEPLNESVQSKPVTEIPVAPVPEPIPVVADSPVKNQYDFVFLHHAPLSSKANEIMQKILAALKKDEKSAPIIYEGDLPKAGIYIVLGISASRKWFPQINAASRAGVWSRLQDADVLITYSPERIIRVLNSSYVTQMKREMWSSLKIVLQRVAQKKEGMFV